MNLPVVYTFFYHELTGAPEAVSGSINLEAVDPTRKIYLDGQWEFYWNRFIITEPETESTPDFIIRVPDSWSNYKLEGENLPAGGSGSYKLTLKGLEYDGTVALFVPDFGGAYRVFIDGELASKSGIVSRSIDSIFTVPKADLFPVTHSGKTTRQVVIETATTRFSGLYMTPVLCDYNRTVNENSFRSAVRFTLFGIAMFSFFSLLSMYFINIRRKLNSFWLPVMIAFILVRIMLTSAFYSTWQPVLFFNIPFESTNEIMYLTTFVLKYLLIFLIQEQCGILFAMREKLGFLFYYISLYSIYLLTPQDIYNRYMSVLIPMLTYALDMHLFMKIYRSHRNMKKSGMAVFAGATLVIAGLALDSYYINGKIYMNMSLSLLFLFTVFAMIMNCVYAMRSGDLYDDYTRSALHLEMANNQLAMQRRADLMN